MSNNERKLNIDDESFEQVNPKKTFARRKKTMYVPDEELLNYSKNKASFENDLSNTTTDVMPEVNDTLDVKDNMPESVVIEETIEEPILQNNAVEEVTETPSLDDNIEQSIDEDLVAEEPVNEDLVTNESTKIIEAVTTTNDTTENKGKSKKTLNKKKKIILTFISIVASIVLVCSATYLIWYFTDLNNQNKKLEFIQSIYDTNRNDYTYNQDGQFSKFDELKRQNSDIRGWLSIDNTELDNPIYQTIDNDFYITHDMNKEKNSYGALFLDFRCDVNPLTISQNQIIYGHNMRYGAMFGTLREYRNLNFYKSHPVINFDSLYETRKYKIVAIMVCDSGVDQAFGYNFTPYTPDFATQEEFLLWIERCRVRSLINTNVDVNAQDEVITLSTCCYDFTDARLVIVARLVREGEDTSVDTSKATVNNKVIYPGKYYEKRKLPIPNVEPPKVTIYDK